MFLAVSQEWLDEKLNIPEDDNSDTTFDFTVKMEKNSPSVTVKTETNSKTPIIYTTRLEDMSIFLHDLVRLSPMEINECIELESRPLFENLNTQTTDIELQSMFYQNMLDKFKKYKLNINNNLDKLNETREFKTSAIPTAGKANTKKNTQKLNTTNDNVNTKDLILKTNYDEDGDLINLNELRIRNINKSLLDLCKPVKVVLQDIGKTDGRTDHQIQKCNNLKRTTRNLNVYGDNYLKIYSQLVNNRLTRIAPKPKPPLLPNSMNRCPALTQLQPTALPTPTTMHTIPTLKPFHHRTKPRVLPPPVGYFTWNPFGDYILFYDLCTKKTEAYFLDAPGQLREYYKLNISSMKELQNFIPFQKFRELICCCWHKREAYIQCMSPMFVPVQTAQLLKKPHKCLIYKCTCCCKGLYSELNVTSELPFNVTESEGTSLRPDRREDVRKCAKEKSDYVQDLLSKSTNPNNLINRALRFDRKKQLETVEMPIITKTFQSKSFEIESGLNIINNCLKSPNVNIKNTINGRTEICIRDSNEKVTLHITDFRCSISEHSSLKSNQGIQNICCWYKLQSLCEKFYLPLSFSTAKHSCPPENCCCCCYKPEIKVINPLLVDGPHPTSVRPSTLNCSHLLDQRKFLPEVSSVNETIKQSILAKMLKTSKSTEMAQNIQSYPLKDTCTVKDYIDKVTVDSLNSSNSRHERLPREVKSKNRLECATPKSLNAGSPPEDCTKLAIPAGTSITDELSEPYQTTCLTSNSTHTGVFSNSFVQTDDLTSYPIIANVFSMAPQSAEVSKTTTPIVNEVLSNSPHKDASDLCAGTSRVLTQTSALDSQDKIIESVISTVIETFKDVRLTIDKDGKVAAALNIPIHTLSTSELKILGNILSHAQSQVESLTSMPNSNINNSINPLESGSAINTMNISSFTNNTPMTTAHPTHSLQSTQSFPTHLTPIVPETTTQTFYKTFSTELGKKVKYYSKSYTSFAMLKKQTKDTCLSLHNVKATKRKMESAKPVQPRSSVISTIKLNAPSTRTSTNDSAMDDEETIQSSNKPGTSYPRLRVISPTKLGIPSARIFTNYSPLDDEDTDQSTNEFRTRYPKVRIISAAKLGALSARSSTNESSLEDEEINQLSKEPGISNVDVESQLLSYSIPVFNQTTESTVHSNAYSNGKRFEGINRY